MANSVVRQPVSGGEPIQKKKISSIQRLSTSAEDESASTDEERMRKDKELQRKPDIQREVKPLEEEDKKPAGGMVQRKQDGTGNFITPGISKKIKKSAGKGQKLPEEILEEMQHSFGERFDQVNIHTDEEAADMNTQLGSQAFTHGRDIYFNSGKYDPGSAEGKRLLAHELTHVVQQTNSNTFGSSGES